MKVEDMMRLAIFICVASLYYSSAISVNGQNPDRVISTADAKITSSFDEAKNQTTVEFRMLGIANTETERAVLSVSASYSGRKPEKLPEDVIFILSIASLKEDRFPRTMAMSVNADGKKLPQVVMLNANKRQLSGDDRRKYLETLVTRMNYDIFRQLMGAKSVTLELPDLTLKFDETRMAKMRELDALLHP